MKNLRLGDVYPCLSRFTPSSTLGFTLIELLTVISIILIVTTMGAATMPGFLQRKTESTAFDTLFHLVVFARTKAIREQEIITLCASDDGINCAGEWHQKIMAFSDDNRNARHDESEVLYKHLTMPTGTPCLQWNVGLNRRYLRFKPDGTNAGTPGHFRFCDPDATHIQKKLVISFTGRTSVKNL